MQTPEEALLIRYGEIGSTGGPSGPPPPPPCPGGTLAKCIAQCPTSPPSAYQDCLNKCIAQVCCPNGKEGSH